MLGLPEMRLVTYDRRGHRRLGAILDGRVVDLPDAVGHPAFPTTLEAFVQSSRGTVLDAARAALARDDVKDHVVKQARVLPPLFPRSLLLPGGSRRAVAGRRRRPGATDRRARAGDPWPAGAAWLDYEPKVAAVLALETKDVETDAVAERIFGYTLVSDWVAKDASGDPVGHVRGRPDRDRPVRGHGRRARSAGDVPAGQGRRRRAREGEPERVGAEPVRADRGRLSRDGARAGGRVRAGPFPARDDDPNRRLWPGALVELAAEGIGTLRNRLGARP